MNYDAAAAEELEGARARELSEVRSAKEAVEVLSAHMSALDFTYRWALKHKHGGGAAGHVCGPAGKLQGLQYGKVHASSALVLALQFVEPSRCSSLTHSFGFYTTYPVTSAAGAVVGSTALHPNHTRDPERGWDHSRVKGVVAKLVRVKDPSTATALEVAAGGRLYQVRWTGPCTRPTLAHTGWGGRGTLT